MFLQGALPREGWIYDDQLANTIFDTFFTNPSAKAINRFSNISNKK